MNVSKVVFYLTIIIVGSLSIFFYGLYAGATRNETYAFVEQEFQSIKKAFDDVEQTAVLHPSTFLQPARGPGSGVTIDRATDRESLIFLTSFFDGNNELRLIRRDGSVVARWPVKFSELFPDSVDLENAPATNWNVDLHGAVIDRDGSVTFNFEYWGMASLDRCGETIWTLPEPTHHSVEFAQGGGYWVPGRLFHGEGEKSPFLPFSTPLKEDTILRVSEEGAVLAEYSVPRLLLDNGLWPLVTGNGASIRDFEFFDDEIVHLNKVVELSPALAPKFPLFAAGDLMISLRTLNMVLVFSPETQKVKWWSVGPWIRQHDPQFTEDGTILVFNNNTYLYDVDALHRPMGLREMVSDIIEIDPNTNEWRVVYGEKDDEPLLTVIRGKVKATDQGGLLVTEFEGGRVFETDPEGEIVWEYINRFDEAQVAEITEARLLPADYFASVDWSCNPASDSKQ